MLFKTLSISVAGSIWRIHELEIEAVDFIDKWDDEASSITLTDFPISNDEILDVYIKLGAPNGTVYEVTIAGELVNGDEVSYKKEFEVERHGRLQILISENINDLLNP